MISPLPWTNSYHGDTANIIGVAKGMTHDDADRASCCVNALNGIFYSIQQQQSKMFERHFIKLFFLYQ